MNIWDCPKCEARNVTSFGDTCKCGFIITNTLTGEGYMSD